ncbi:MAG: GNAT family N-acetyltransferase [Erythrobacter sp.]
MTVMICQIDQIMAVMNAAFDPAYGEAWNRRQITDALALPNTHAQLIGASGRLLDEKGNNPEELAAGFVLTRNAADEVELLLIGVIPEYRTQGLGQILIKQLIISAQEKGVARIFLEMRRGNPALHLYQKFGFSQIGERRDYYRLPNGEKLDAITFAKEI